MQNDSTTFRSLLHQRPTRPRFIRGVDFTHAFVDPLDPIEVAYPPLHPAHPQRRGESRFEPIEDRLWVQWWEGGDLHGRSAQLVNISHHGAMIVTAARFTVDSTVCLYLEEPAPQVSVRARVLEVIEGLHGLDQVRLVFDLPCPDTFFEAAANGFESWLQGSDPKV